MPCVIQEEVALPMGEVEEVRVQKTDAPAAADLPICSKTVFKQLRQKEANHVALSLVLVTYLLHVPDSMSQQSSTHVLTGHLREFKSLQQNLDRTLRLEAQLQHLILQAQKP
ncbi:hypothetical protein PSHT_07723 [Puccinia striiformis]|uniref:Uncharacterized protein n=2 Tax=Puccinia striiformis TaxID=27350 RepID=A0A2S4VI60_9BASI|nr:hypothetical protein PSTT_06947 [Puccinia striiformis]POW13558.1 hypothetical protein PSHT_07723 [Puccinia striiformis]